MSFSCFRGSNSSARVNCGLGREGKGPEHRAWEQGRLLSPTVEVGTQSKLQFAASRWPRAGTTTATPPPPPHSCTGDVYKACSLTAAVPPSRNKCDVFVLSMAGLAALLKTGQVSPVDGGERGKPPLLLLLSDLLTASPEGLIHGREGWGAAWIHQPPRASSAENGPEGTKTHTVSGFYVHRKFAFFCYVYTQMTPP